MDHDLIIPKTCPLCDSEMSLVGEKDYYFCSKLLEYSGFYTSFRLGRISNNKMQGGYSHYFIINPLIDNANHATEVFIFKPYHIFAYNQLNKFSIQKFSHTTESGVKTEEYYSGMQLDLSKMPRTEEDFQNWMILK